MPDPLLSELVASVDHQPTSELDITIFVQGAIMTGTLVNEYAYTKALIPQLRALVQASGTTAQPVVSSSAATTYDVPEQYLHLRDVQVLMMPHPLTFPADQLGMWRVRLDAVDGWMFGRARLG